jgi:hypothetical protein
VIDQQDGPMPDGMPNEAGPEKPGIEPAKEPLRELTLGQSRRSPDRPNPRRSSSSSSPPRPNEDLETLATRCRAKAEAARWAAERQRRIRERDDRPDEDEPADPFPRDWAETLTDAYYWSGTSEPCGAADPSILDLVGGCFETLSEGLHLLDSAQRRRSGLEKALPLVAEAQSAVRRSLQRLRVQDDPDQLTVYEAVRESAARHRIFLKRFMRADDLADPEGWPNLLARIESRSGGGAPSQRQQSLFENLRSLCASKDTGATDASWRAIVSAVEQLVVEGTPPSSREIRDSLLPILDDLPEMEDLPAGFRLVLREIDRYLATRSSGLVEVASTEPTAEVRGAAELLKGRSAVLIGGIRRPQAQELLRTTLGLKELVWIGTREHQSIRGFEAVIARPEVAVVLLAIRWSSHAFGEVKPFCERHGKPLVRLPGGYNPSQVAVQILAQCSGQLGG